MHKESGIATPGKLQLLITAGMLLRINVQQVQFCVQNEQVKSMWPRSFLKVLFNSKCVQ